MKTQLFFALAFATLPISSCDDPVEDMKPINIDSKSQELVHADNEFGIDVFKLLNETEQNNFTISPLSISLALAMTYNGAEGETKIAMEEALRVSGFTKEEINLSYKGLMNALLSADGRVTLEIAQSIWYRLNFNVLDNFKTLNQTYYDAEVNELDFGRSDAKDIINGWIEDHTHDKIKDMINSVDPLHVMFLVNAIYFNGEWRTKFNKEDTRKQNFTKEDGTVIQADMMQRKGTINYFSNDVFSAIEMPYGRGNFNMVVLLPNEGKKCNDVVEILTAEKWSEWMDMFGESEDVSIWMPKFKDEYKVMLNDVLSAMGMGVAFTGAADFSGINGSGGIYIDYVQHNTFIDVNEKGTEAAAATVVAIKETAMPMSPEFHVTRPFLYAITEKQTGAILFIGKMNEPSYE